MVVNTAQKLSVCRGILEMANRVGPGMFLITMDGGSLPRCCGGVDVHSILPSFDIHRSKLDGCCDSSFLSDEVEDVAASSLE